ncbi:hypothetical protein KDM41_11075 [bacterium]|nr:hypothetical protein [bacterium]
MATKKLIVLLASVVVLASGLIIAGDSEAINLYGGPCDVAEQLGYQSQNWNTLCAIHIQNIEACCSAGGCESYPCG